MSLASRIVGFPDLEVERVDRNKGIEVWARPANRPPARIVALISSELRPPMKGLSSTPAKAIR